jgi:membrane-bound serine protease (ClpP class)
VSAGEGVYTLVIEGLMILLTAVQRLMSHRSFFIRFAVSLLLMSGAVPASGQDEMAQPHAVRSAAVILHVKGAIGPATSDYLRRGFHAARDRGAALIIIEMDTPGGLDTAMRDIIQDIIASTIPVVTYVAPSGARAASAGTYIMYASHVAAMAPGTNIGAATPVQLGGMPGSPDQGNAGGDGKKDQGGGEQETMERKMTNDAVAYIRSLAQMRGRNADWAEQAVRKAASLPAREALDKGVIDLMAADMEDLLHKLDGRKVVVAGQERVLHTANLSLERIEPDWRTDILAMLTDPNVAYILMLVGIYGLIYEFINPGLIIPGVAGLICLLLALFAFQILPINYAGLALILLGIAFMVGEAFVPSFGALGIGGVLAFVVGSIMLMDTGAPGFGISWYVIGSFTLVSAAFFILVISLLVKSRRVPVVTGKEELIGSGGEVLEDFNGDGLVRVHGEIWSAHARAPLKKGQRIRVTAREGLVLSVEPHEMIDREN